MRSNITAIFLNLVNTQYAGLVLELVHSAMINLLSYGRPLPSLACGQHHCLPYIDRANFKEESYAKLYWSRP